MVKTLLLFLTLHFGILGPHPHGMRKARGSNYFEDRKTQQEEKTSFSPKK